MADVEAAASQVLLALACDRGSPRGEGVELGQDDAYATPGGQDVVDCAMVPAASAPRMRRTAFIFAAQTMFVD